MLKHFGVEEGLTSNRVYTAFQDSKGFIWLATTNGVSRFDGKTFKNYTSNNGLPDNDIFDISEDAAGKIWLSCYNGEPCYIWNNKVFTTTEDSSLKLIPSHGYFRFSRLANKLILTKSASGRSFEVDETGVLKQNPLEGVYFLSFKNNLIHAFVSPATNHARYYLLDKHYKYTDSLCFPENNTPTQVSPVVENIYATGDSSFVVRLKNKTCLFYCIQSNKIVFLSQFEKTPDFKTLYHFNNQLFLLAPDEGGVVPVNAHLQKDSTKEAIFAKLAIQNFMIDREGNYWGCSSGKGLYMIPNNGFSYYESNNAPGQNDFLKLKFSQGQIYLGCAKNILICPSGNRNYNTSTYNFCALEDRLVDLFPDSSKLIVATTEALIRFDKKTKAFTKTPFHNIKCMRKGPGNSVLFGTHSACFQFRFPDKLDTLFNGRSVAVCPLKNGEVVIGTLNGLFISRKTDSGIWKSSAMDIPDALRKTRISCLEELDEILVVGTVQNGLAFLKGRDYEFVNLGPGLNNINCKDLFIDKNKNIWLSSFSGIFKIVLGKNIHTYTIENIRKFNGLLSDDVNASMVLNDTVYAVGSAGLSVFYSQPRKKTAETGPSVFINDVRVNNVSYPTASGELHLPADSNSIDLNFSAIDFKSLGNILFKYRLSPLQKNWHFSRDNTVRFEALAFGTYELEMMAMNSENIWSPQTLKFRISIAPAWWQTVWFYFLLLVAGTGFIYLALKRNLTKKHKTYMRENSLKRHVAELELRALKAQINPHFIFNTLNAIQYFISNNENEQAENYLNRMAELLRKTLDFSDKTTVPLSAEMRYLENYLELEKLRFDAHFNFSITNLIPAGTTNPEIPPMVLQPHIENALRHGFKNKQNEFKHIEIRFRMLEKQLVCEVQDNGVGRSAASLYKNEETQYRSRGMELSQSKLLIYEAITGKTIKTEIEDLYSEDKHIAKGTLIRIFISQ